MHSGGLAHPEQKMTAVKTELQCDRGKTDSMIFKSLAQN